MTDIAVIGNTTITTEDIKASMDGKSFKFMTDSAIDKISTMDWSYINTKTDITNYTEQQVVSALYAMTTWHIYNIYVESISDYIQGQSPAIADARISNYKEIAILFLDIIGVSLDITTVLNQKIPCGVLTDTCD